jgi:hypothetical protein
MNKQLIQGIFLANDALGIIEKMIAIKIQYHENKINNTSNEEDIKNRETKIKQLQNDWSDIREFIVTTGGKINIQSAIDLSV